MMRKISFILDSIADNIEERGLLREAYQIDIIANTIDKSSGTFLNSEPETGPNDISNYLQNTYKDQKKILTPGDIYIRFGFRPSAEAIAKALKIPVEKVEEEIKRSDKEQKLKRDKENELWDKEMEKQKKAIMQGDPEATIKNSIVFDNQDWYEKKYKENLGKWSDHKYYEYLKTFIKDPVSTTWNNPFFGADEQKLKRLSWVLECPFEKKEWKDLYEKRLQDINKNKIQVGDIIVGKLSPGRKKDPILTNTGKEGHPIIVVNKAPKDKIGEQVKVKIKRVLENVIISEYTPS